MSCTYSAVLSVQGRKRSGGAENWGVWNSGRRSRCVLRRTFLSKLRRGRACLVRCSAVRSGLTPFTPPFKCFLNGNLNRCLGNSALLSGLVRVHQFVFEIDVAPCGAWSASWPRGPGGTDLMGLQGTSQSCKDALSPDVRLRLQLGNQSRCGGRSCSGQALACRLLFLGICA